MFLLVHLTFFTLRITTKKVKSLVYMLVIIPT